MAANPRIYFFFAGEPAGLGVLAPSSLKPAGHAARVRSPNSHVGSAMANAWIPSRRRKRVVSTESNARFRENLE